MIKTVADVIQDLMQLDQQAPVLLARDPEGNGFKRYDETGTVMVRKGDPLAGDVDTYDMNDLEEDQTAEDFTEAVVLWP